MSGSPKMDGQKAGSQRRGQGWLSPWDESEGQRPGDVLTLVYDEVQGPGGPAEALAANLPYLALPVSPLPLSPSPVAPQHPAWLTRAL